jgi:hypothetical protein
MNAWALVWRVALTMGAVMGAASALETVGLERYQVIVQRSPFGTPAAGAEASAPAPNWAEAYTFVGLVPDPVSTNVLAIIQDRERSYLRRVGEMVGEAKVKAIVTAGRASQLVLERGLESVPLRFKDPAAGGVPPLPVPAAGTPGVPTAQAASAPNQPAGGAVPPRRRIPFRRGQ